MALLRPFRALRPSPTSAARVAAVPYDVVNREEALALAQANPLSFLHVSRAEIDLPASLNPYDPQVYAEARRQLERLTREAPLVRDTEPTLTLYQLEREGRVQTGIAATFSIDEYDRGDIRKHERTRQDKEDDRTRHVLTLGAQTGPVFLAYRGTQAIRDLTQSLSRQAPGVHFIAPDGIRHTLWTIPQSQCAPWVTAFAQVPRLYIADGHHRAASAARARAELARTAGTQGGDDYKFVLAVAFPAEELHILPYHRLLLDTNGLADGEILTRLEADFLLTRGAKPEPAPGCFAVYMKGEWYGMEPKRSLARGSSRIAHLDVSILQDSVLQPLFGIQDPRTDKRIEFVGGARGPAELERRVLSGEARIAFAMSATTLDDLMAVSDANDIMPPKSTWFEPKLRDGLVSHLIQG